MGEVVLVGGAVATVDDDLAERLSAYRWYSSGGYARAKIGGKFLQMARLVIDVPEGMVPDHINGDKLDNRRANLRACTQAQNVRNRRMSRTTACGFRGVYFLETGKYQARISLDRHTRYSACYMTAIAAALAYDAMARELHGEFASFNFPDLVIAWEWRPGTQPRTQRRFREFRRAA